MVRGERQDAVEHGCSRRSREGSNRRGIALLAGLLVLGGLAVAVPATAQQARASDPEEERPAHLDDPEFRALIEEAIARQEEEAEQRETPEAEQAREDSASAFESQTAAEALATATEEHAEVLGEPAWRAFSTLPASEVERYYDDDFQARVDVPGESADAFAESTVPLRAETESGGEAPVDLSLTDHGDGLEPKAPLVETTIPDDLDQGVSLDESGIGLAPQGAEAAAPAELANDTAFYANVQPDSDFLVQPAPTGVEALFQLRSAESPESVTLEFELPPGATLQEGGQLDGAHVVRAGEEVALVTRPVAFDAEGWPVELSHRVEGNRMVIEAPHRDQDPAYPILIDPVVTENQSSFADRQGWSVRRWPAGTDPAAVQGNGYLYIAGAGGSNYYNYLENAEWVFDSPGPEASIFAVTFANVIVGNIDHRSIINQGIHVPSINAWDTGTILYTSLFSSSPIVSGATFNAPSIGHCNGPQSAYCVGGAGGNRTVMGIYSTVNGTIPNGFMHYAGGATTLMFDQTKPTVRFADDTAEWVNDELAVVTEARDRGLGVKSYSVKLDSGAERIRTHACAGHRFDRCPNQDSYYPSDGARVTGSSFSYDTSALPEGEHTLTAKAKDFADNWSPTQTRNVNVDHTEPSVEVSGPLADAPGSWVSQGDYQVTGSAQDPQSGVTQLQLWIDDEEVDDATQPCSAGGCSLDHTFTVDTSEYGGGAHLAEIVATDGAGNSDAQSWEFNVNPAGVISGDEAAATLQVAEPSGLELPDETASPTISEHFADGFSVDTSDGAITLIPSDAGSNVTAAHPVDDDTSVYANMGAESDTALAPIVGGVDSFTQIRSDDAPAGYSWEVDLQGGNTLREAAPLEGSDQETAEVVSGSGDVLLSIGAASAVDATGASVPMDLSVAGNTVALTVQHSSAYHRYPVVVEEAALAVTAGDSVDAGVVWDEENTHVSLPAQGDGIVSIEGDAGTISLVLPATGSPLDESGGTEEVFDGQAPGTQVSVQSLGYGAEARVHIEDSEAPESYEFPLGADAASLDPQPDGSTFVLDENSQQIAVIAAPWARDADGNSVSTRYEFDGTTVNQVVEHQGGGYAYPIVADPPVITATHVGWKFSRNLSRQIFRRVLGTAAGTIAAIACGRINLLAGVACGAVVGAIANQIGKHAARLAFRRGRCLEAGIRLRFGFPPTLPYAKIVGC